ncbi:NADH-quinone oxidoreductase subunit NuoN [Ottowia sp. GY511]|uniref:NADH-quinone oxidoreductase subunit N n=1 Tax=Ottowia flava TaxID=2675430 RepID=A0ABW4KUP7_9BURK|nr:NADH-quinone oxidoreductase subunit NuoN [Ottowia sp. GY511]TXK23382.1 NADH-quinone oxidoreductase subunit NuoN [Ottowia sp. GY511]
MIDRFSWVAIYPEIVLLVMACAIALLDLFDRSRGRKVAYVLSLLTLLVLAVLTGMNASAGQTVYGFGGIVVSDQMANWLKCFAALSVAVTFVYSRTYIGDRGMVRGGEWYVLSLLSLLGIYVMISANNFLLIYLGLECLTLAGYALVALRRDHVSSVEAAMKYFVLGAMASGFLLYGLSMMYGATGTLDIPGVFRAVATGQIKHQVLVFGLVFIVAGLAFKFGAVPFHMWIPDVYQGAPTSVTLIIGSAPKLAAFAMAIRLLVEGLLPLAIDWQQMLGVLAIASLLLGNLASVVQTNLKRMLAYSTIAQIGFVFLGLMAGVAGGTALGAANAYSSAMFYVVTYVMTTLVSFGIILLLSREGFESEEIADLAGLNQRSPLYAGIMAVCLFSLAGIPPLVGFQAKLSVLQALISAGSGLHIAIAVFAVLMSLIGAFAYLRVVKVMYFDDAASDAPIRAPWDMRAVLSVNGALLLVLGVLPGTLMTLCARAVVQMLSS